MKTSGNDAALRAADIKRTQMKNVPLVAVLFAAAIAALVSQRATAEEGVAVAIVYDTSGSMKDPVRDQSGKSSPKFVVANRALIAIAKQIQTFATNSAVGGPRKIEAGVFVFDKNSAREAVNFGPFDESAIESFANSFSNPTGNTPLGNALTVASRAVLKSPLNHKHILVITDGMNTAGPKPEEVLPKLKQQALQKGTALSTHFVAFDVDAKVFAPVKKLDATVVAAADEKQLDTQLQFILQRKILLEEEEPPKKP
jgi:von Willebrand factor type A domain